MNDKCLYFHINKESQEVFYVGIGNYDRPFDFRKRGKFWNDYIKKHPNFIIFIEKDNLTWEQACELEIFFIKKIGRRDLGLGTLVNLTDGGDGLNNISEETRLKMSISQSKRKHKQESKDKISNWGKNKTWEEMYGVETSNKMKEDRKKSDRECLECKRIIKIFCKDMCSACYNHKNYIKNNKTPNNKRRKCQRRIYIKNLE